MAQARENLIGLRFGYLEVIDYGKIIAKDSRHIRYYYKCKCDCGKIKMVRSDALKKGDTKSCGCWSVKNPPRVLHGYSKTRLYKVFRDMKTRCYNPNSPDYKHYGGRGIKICKEWLEDYKTFKEWAESNGYDEKAPKMQCTIDRIDVNGNYEPSNCRWATPKEQMANKRKLPKKLKYDISILERARNTKSNKAVEACKELGLKYSQLKYALSYYHTTFTKLKNSDSSKDYDIF